MNLQRRSKGIILLSLFIIGLLTTFVLTKDFDINKGKAAVGFNAPLFELRDIEGRAWRLADLTGNVVLLNFWAMRCQLCDGVNRSIQRLIDAKRENNEEFVFISILLNGDDSYIVAEYMKASGLNFPVLIDCKREIAGKYGVTGVPEAFIINREGIIKKRVTGLIEWDSPGAMAIIEKFL